MLPREEFKHMAIGHYITANPTASIDQVRLFSEGATMAWDYFARKKREEEAKRIFVPKLSPIAEALK